MNFENEQIKNKILEDVQNTSQLILTIILLSLLINYLEII